MNHFTELNDLGLRIPTKWCDPSIVDATLQSIRSIVSKKDGIEVLHIASGHDIPIIPPEQFFRDRRVSFLDGYSVLRRANRTCMKIFSTGFASGFFKPMKLDLRAEGILDNHFIDHSQWMSLSQEHCEILANSLDTFDLLLPAAQALLAMGECYPDEWMIGTILYYKLQCHSEELPPSITDVENTAVVYPDRKLPADPVRPIVWRHLHRYRKKCTLGDRDGEYCLSDILEFYMSTPYLFFRKITYIDDLAGFYRDKLIRDGDGKSVCPHRKLRSQECKVCAGPKAAQTSEAAPSHRQSTRKRKSLDSGICENKSKPAPKPAQSTKPLIPLDTTVQAWLDPHPKEGGIFVLIDTQYNREVGTRVAHYVPLDVWTREKTKLPLDPKQRVRELMKHYVVHVSEQEEVDRWISEHPVFLHAGKKLPKV